MHRRRSLDEVGQPCLGRDVTGLERLDLCGPLRMDGRRDTAVVVDNDQGGDHSSRACDRTGERDERARSAATLAAKQGRRATRLLLGDRGELIERGRDEDLEIVICAPAAVVRNACHRPQGLADPTLAGRALPRDVFAALVACPRTGRLSAGALGPPLCVLPRRCLLRTPMAATVPAGCHSVRMCASSPTLRRTSRFDQFRSGAA